ncbi:hypothetical protein DFP72DRAFT_1167358 [Ephemerocybe angulata]|uniref:F-box domain-containing protein n=1 Tax=Ephemerocybe angulata TaxID=980116 RepID=A0A8H6MAY6_9AGAR|nr:hypothetical protein DFP72DRAFT_1167358 [Tulosesus angulatus]
MNWQYNSDEARTRLDSFIQESRQKGPARGPSVTLDETTNVVMYTDPPCLRMVKTGDDVHEEVAVTVAGILCDKVLPPVLSLRSHKFEHVRYLRQFVRLTGLGSNNFQEELSPFTVIESRFRNTVDVTDLQGFDFGVYEGEPCVALHARYLTERRLARSLRHIPFPPEIDPNHALEDARDTKFIRTEDNVVQYARKIVEHDGSIRIETLRPEEFKEGDIVEATGTFVAYPTSEPGEYVLVFVLRALTMLCSSFREASQVKRKARMEEEERKGPKRKRSKVDMPTAKGLKRAYISPHAMERNDFFAGWLKLPPELKDHVFDFLSLSDVISFCQVSLPFRAYAIRRMRTRLVGLTERYELPLYTLLLILDRTNAVISGSLALELVHPTGLVPNNLDFVCPIQEADGLCSFLFTKGYVPVPDRPIFPLIIDDVPGRNCIEAVRTLRHSVRGSIIHVIVSTSSSPLTPIFSAHSTFLMNFVSASAIYSCYPSLTEKCIGVRNVTDKMVTVQPRRQQDQEKYMHRGFTFVEGCQPLSGTSPHVVTETCLHRTRAVIDPETAVLPFDMFRSSSSVWPKTEWRLGCKLILSGGDVVTAETLIEVYCDGTDNWMHGNNLGRLIVSNIVVPLVLAPFTIHDKEIKRTVKETMSFSVKVHAFAMQDDKYKYLVWRVVTDLKETTIGET